MCDGLALSNVSKALADLDDDDKLKLTKDELDTLTSSEGIKCSVDARVQSLNLVSESWYADCNRIPNPVESSDEVPSMGDEDKVVESASNFDSNDLLESGNSRITLISESGLYNVQALINRGVVNDVKNLTSLNIKNENGNGAVKTTLYDLKVFNYLVMCLDTDQAWAKKATQT